MNHIIREKTSVIKNKKKIKKIINLPSIHYLIYNL